MEGNENVRNVYIREGEVEHPLSWILVDKKFDSWKQASAARSLMEEENSYTRAVKRVYRKLRYAC